MPDLNDVVRHVILRIVVDQAELAEELAAARAKLKALKDSEKEINKERAKNSDVVTQAIAAQNKALDDNAQAHTAAQRAAENGGRAVADQHRAATAGIKDETRAVEQRTVAEAKAAQIDEQTKQKQLDAQRARSAARKRDADEEAKRTLDLAALEERQRQQRLAKDAERRRYNQQTADVEATNAAKQAALQARLDTEQKDREKAAADRRSAERKRALGELEKLAAITEQVKAKTSEVEERARNVKLGGQTERTIQRTESDARVTRKDTESSSRVSQREFESLSRVERQDTTAQAATTRADISAQARQLRDDVNAAAARQRLDAESTAKRERLEAESTNKRRLDSLKVTTAVERAEEESGQRIFQRQETHEERLNTLRRTNEQKQTSQALLDIEKVATAQARRTEVELRSGDSQQRREATRPGYIAAENAKHTAAVEISGARTDKEQSAAQAAAARAQVAESQAQVAASRAVNEADKANLDVATRRERLELALARAKEDTRKVAAQTELIEQRAVALAERRERMENQRGSRQGVIASTVAAIGNVATAVATPVFQGNDNTRYRNARNAMTEVGQETNSARRALTEFFNVFRNQDRDTRLTNAKRELRSVREESGLGARAIAGFFRGFVKGGEDTNKALSFLTSRVRNFWKEMKPASSGGGNLFGNFFNNVNNVADGIIGSISKVGRHLFSFQTLIIAVIAAFGPLMAIMGAVGAVALGLASNLGALAGSLLALPGLLGAAVAGFGALALVMKPITSVFSAYTAAQKASTRATNEERKATEALADARVAAKRKIEDYQAALRKLKFDEEGAALGVESAKQAYMQALVDPTSSALDVAQAKHNYEQSLFDQQQQKTDARRTREDAGKAISRGVEGSTEVQGAKATQAATATQQYKDQLDKLPASTRKVVEAIIALKDQYTKIRNTLSENIFGPVSKDTAKFKDVLQILADFMTPASQAIGKLLKAALDLFTNPEWRKFFQQQGKESGYIIQQLGDALLHTADAFRGIIEAARPFTRFVVDGILGMAKAFDSFATSETGREKIRKFLELTQKRIQELWPVLKNFAAGIAGFFAALNTAGGGETDFTSWLNKGLLEASQHFRELGDMAGDPDSGFQKWLRAVRPLIHDVAELLASAGRAFGKLFSNKNNLDEAERLLKAISEKWLPKLAEIFDNLSKSGVISKLATAIGDALDSLNNFFEHGGTTALGAFAEGISKAAEFLNWMTNTIPGLINVLGVLATVLATVFGAALFLKFSGIYDMIKLTGGAVKVLLGLLKGEKLSDLLNFGGGGGKPGGNGGKNTPAKPTPNTPGGAPAIIDEADDKAELRVLRRIEAYARQIALNTGGTGQADVDIDKDEKNKNKPSSKTKPGDVLGDVEKDAKNAARGGGKGKGGLIRRLFGGGAAVAEDVAVDAAVAGGATAAASKSGGFFSGGIKKFFTGGGGKSAAGVAEEAAGAGSKLGGLAKFAKGGPAAIVASIAATMVGDAAINKFVKNDKDKGSLSRGLGAVATGASIGATIGSIVPGVGTAIGGVVGGAAGGIYSLVKDKNLRDFLGGKIAGGAKGLAGAVSGIFGGSDGKVGVGGAIAAATGPIGALLGKTDIGKSIIDSLDKAGGKVGNFFTKTLPDFAGGAVDKVGGFFTKTIPHAFNSATSGIKNFFTKTLPSLPGKAFDFVFIETGRLLKFFIKDLPAAVHKFFTKTVPDAASRAWSFIHDNLWDPFWKFITVTLPHAVANFFTRTIPEKAAEAWTWVQTNLWDPFVGFIKGIPHFFTTTIPHWFDSAWSWFTTSVADPLNKFITETIPNFFTETIPKWFEAAPGWFKTHVIDPIATFFTTTVPNFFTQDLPRAIEAIPGVLYNKLIKPIGDFLGSIGDGITEAIKGGAKHVGDWVKAIWDRATGDVQKGYEGKMSGGLISGVYQGIQDTAHVMATPGEFMFRKSVVDEPGAKMIMADWNDGRINVADLYKGLSATSSPQVMSMVPPEAAALTGSVPTIVNNTVNHAPLMGDVTINNPVREKSEYSLRRRVELAAIRHRR